MINCPLCGYAFSREESDRCAVCPVNRNCGLICCPGCGYRFVEDSWIVGKWRDLKCMFKSGRADERDAADAS